MFKEYKANKRSPLKVSPLRLPGQSLDERIDDIVYDKLVVYVVVIGLILLSVINEWMRFYFNFPPKPLGISIIATVVIAFCVWKILKLLKNIKNLRLGSEGEKTVGQSLECLREAGYRVFHDVIDEGFNIDHVLVGPAGVFTIETKTIGKSRSGESKVYFDGTNITIDGFKLDRDPIAQAKNQKYWLENFILEFTKLKIKVRPVVIFPGWFINQAPGNLEVWVLNEKALAGYLANKAAALSDEQINLISSNLENYIRNY